MASAIDTARSDAEIGLAPHRGWRLPGSRLGRLIIVLNLLGLAILIVGALVLNETRQGLINAEIDSLTTQGEFIANVIEKAATRGDPEPMLEPDLTRKTIDLLFIPKLQRARIFDAHGALVADSYVIADRVELKPLPPARKPGEIRLNDWLRDRDARPEAVAQARADLNAEVARALKGERVHLLRRAQNGDRVVSISIPIQYVHAVLGVLTLEAGDVDQIIAAQRRALLPFILVDIAVTLVSSLLLSRLVAEPVLRLARAADRVTAARARAISLPDIASRDDELGDLTRSLETMTFALSERMDAIERFAADVAHEIRNPLTSIRSAVETLDLISDPVARDRLTSILKQDVQRLDRLITDISNASRLDAELSRESPRRIDMARLIGDIAELYVQSARPGEAVVRFIPPANGEPAMVQGREGPFSQVFRNLIDNARSFSVLSDRDPSEVRVAVRRAGHEVVTTVEDDGPGIPAENLETVFERFYTSRPKGAAFGGHSGLGLSIARQIIQAHGGRIRAENRTDADGKILGARFVVTLPESRA
ncbi:MAG: stimulus-sensing domain-containing protein [Caulobacteraceae bacterium]|nr:stimulus-sensing domain-containing protein [Caulobacteraceae bacterium]